MWIRTSITNQHDIFKSSFIDDIVLLIIVVNRDDTCSSSTESAATASGRKGRERERRPVFHTWLCYVETERHTERRTDGPGESPLYGHDDGGDVFSGSGCRACSRRTVSRNTHVVRPPSMRSSWCYPGIRVTARSFGRRDVRFPRDHSRQMIDARDGVNLCNQTLR